MHGALGALHMASRLEIHSASDRSRGYPAQIIMQIEMPRSQHTGHHTTAPEQGGGVGIEIPLLELSKLA